MERLLKILFRTRNENTKIIEHFVVNLRIHSKWGDVVRSLSVWNGMKILLFGISLYLFCALKCLVHPFVIVLYLSYLLQTRLQKYKTLATN